MNASATALLQPHEGIMYIDYRDGQVCFSPDFERLLVTSYVNAPEGIPAALAPLARYMLWEAWVAPVLSDARVAATPAFISWMSAPYTDTDHPHAQLFPALPRAAAAAAYAFPYCGGPDLLGTEAGRITLLGWFFLSFSTILPSHTPPRWIEKYLDFPPDAPWPLWVEACWRNLPHLHQDYPCRNDLEKTHFLAFSSQIAHQIYPGGNMPAAIQARLDSLVPSGREEGLTCGMHASLLCRQNPPGLASPMERLAAVVGMLMENTEAPVPPPVWEALCRPLEGSSSPLPKFAYGLGCIEGLFSREETAGTGADTGTALEERLWCLFLHKARPFYSRHQLPHEAVDYLLAPAPLEQAAENGISSLMYFLEKADAKHDSPDAGEQSYAGYLRTFPELPADLSPAWWQVAAWSKQNTADDSPPAVRDYSAQRRPESVSVTGWADGATGVGEDCRTLHSALASQSIQSSLVLATPFVPYWGKPFALHTPAADAPDGLYTIICLAAQDIFRLRHAAPRHWWAGRYTIGLCPWELPEWPRAVKEYLAPLNEIWAPSGFIEQAFSGFGKPVVRMPLAVIPLSAQGDLRDELGISRESTVFMGAYDSNASYLRKNPLATLQAFNKAFANTKHDARLIIKTMNAENHAHAWKELHDANRCGDRVIFINECLSPEKNAQLLNTCDAFVSLHRSEGFGRLLAEAMTLGKLLIASNFGGNTDFTTQDTACPVKGRLTPLQNADYLFAEGQHWFDADTDHAAEIMRSFCESPGHFSDRAIAGKQLVLTQHSLKQVGARAKQRLEMLGFT